MNNFKRVSLTQQKFISVPNSDPENDVPRRKPKNQKDSQFNFENRVFRNITSSITEVKEKTDQNDHLKHHFGSILAS